MLVGFRRDRLTWVAYVVGAWFAYLQAAPGLVVVHLRDELDLSYAAGGLHVAAFAAGSTVAGLVSARLEGWLGRRKLLWSASALLGAGVVGLTVASTVEVTVGSVLVMGIGGGLVLGTVQAALADRHGEFRTVALAEENVAASISYLTLVGVLSLAAALQLGWRVALLASLVVPIVAWWCSRRVSIEAPPPSQVVAGRLPVVFWIAAAMLFCTTAAEWCVTAWGRDVCSGRRRGVQRHRGRSDGRLLRWRAGRAHTRQPAGASVRSGAAARDSAWCHGGRVRSPVAVDHAGTGAGRFVAARDRPREPVPDGRVAGRRARPRAVGPGQRSSSGDVLVRGRAGTPHRRGAGGRDLAEDGPRGGAGHGRTGRGGAHACRSYSGSNKRPN